jgi:hypothetical protein
MFARIKYPVGPWHAPTLPAERIEETDMWQTSSTHPIEALKIGIMSLE